MNSLLLRTASRRAAASAVRSSTSASSVRSASVLAGTTSPFSSSLTSPSPVTTLRGSGFKIAAATTTPSSFGGGQFRHLSTFLASYDEHVSERAALADGLGVAPQPLGAAQVAELIEEMRAAKDGDDGADRVRFAEMAALKPIVTIYK